MHGYLPYQLPLMCIIKKKDKIKKNNFLVHKMKENEDGRWEKITNFDYSYKTVIINNYTDSLYTVHIQYFALLYSLLTATLVYIY